MRRRQAFTLIEIMLAVLILAMLASMASLNFASSTRNAREHEAIEQLQARDQYMRHSARTFGRASEIPFNLDSASTSIRTDYVRTMGTGATSGEFRIPCSPLGITPSYAIHLSGASTDRWLIVSGLTGQFTQAKDEAEVVSILNTTRRDAR